LDGFFLGIFIFIIFALALWWFLLRRKSSSYSIPISYDSPDPKNAGHFHNGGEFSVAMAQNEAYVYQHKDEIAAFHAQNEKFAQENERKKLQKMRNEYDPFEYYS
jgi:hypothetical protein